MLYFKKDPIVEDELVLIYIEDQPSFYGRVEMITPDVKPKWWRVKFLFLTIPCKITTWIIDEEQIRGADFTMGGTPIRIEKIIIPEDEETADKQDEEQQSPEEGQLKLKKARVLSLHKTGNKGESRKPDN